MLVEDVREVVYRATDYYDEFSEQGRVVLIINNHRYDLCIQPMTNGEAPYVKIYISFRGIDHLFSTILPVVDFSWESILQEIEARPRTIMKRLFGGLV